jgi:hypothetical protein
MSNRTKEIALEILSQLGGNQFRAMTGVTNLGYGADSQENPYLQFSLPKGGFNVNKYSKVRVVYTPLDLYTVEFFKKKKVDGIMQDVVVKSLEDIYCDQLRDVFEVETNLLTSLAPRDGNIQIKGGLGGCVSY